jgi:alpha-N-arabinofuranosidase
MLRSFRNPILGGFYPDPSICRVENDFYLVNSTFAYFPGIPIFHSRDLCHWKQIGNAIDRPGQLCFDGHRISEGLFAPTIRCNRGTFYILCTLIRTGGNFIITAQDPAGPWSDPLWLPGADGIDPSIFFDDDGNAWYTGTHAAPEGEAYPGNYEIYIQQLDLSALAGGGPPLIGESTGIWRGALRDAVWPEGPHIYKINGWYYLLHAEGGTGLDHAVCVARAKNIRGLWEGKKSNPVLTHRHLGKNAEIINAGHADMVDDTLGNWWMALLASRPFYGVCPLGRETFMVPILWEDGWPYIGSKTGLIEKEFALPDLADTKTDAADWTHESSCDHFDAKMPLHWLMLRMPAREQDAALSLTARPGALRLFTRAATMRGADHPAFAGRRLRHKNWAFSAEVEFTPKTRGESAGIILLQSEDWQYRFELFLADSGRPSLRLVRAAGKEDEIIASVECSEIECPECAARTRLVLAARCDEMELSFFYGKDQYSLKHYAGPVDGRILSSEYAGGFVGTLAGVFASGNGKDTGNYADVFWAEYTGVTS